MECGFLRVLSAELEDLPGQERGMFGEGPEGIVWGFGKYHQFSRLRFVTSQSFELQGSLKCRNLCLELCWLVSCFVKIPESGEAEEKKDQFFQCVFVWSHKCEFSDQIISLSFIYNVRCFPACFAECTFWSSPSLNWDLHQPFKCISSLFTAQWSGCSLHSWVKNVEKSNFDASNLNENLSAFPFYHSSILSFL